MTWATLGLISGFGGTARTRRLWRNGDDFPGCITAAVTSTLAELNCPG